MKTNKEREIFKWCLWLPKDFPGHTSAACDEQSLKPIWRLALISTPHKIYREFWPRNTMVNPGFADKKESDVEIVEPESTVPKDIRKFVVKHKCYMSFQNQDKEEST